MGLAELAAWPSIDKYSAGRGLPALAGHLQLCVLYAKWLNTKAITHGSIIAHGDTYTF
jgi:hypothetical protein